MLNMAIPGMVAARLDANPTRNVVGAADKSCIFLLLCGGPSHLDTWDLKPDAPDTIRGPYKPIATAVPGMQLSELHTRLAKLTQHFSLIRSMTHPGNISNHFDAMHNCLSGQESAMPDSPYMGSILAKLRPSKRNVVSYAWLIKCVGDPVFCAPNIGTRGTSWGALARPVFIGSGNESSRRLPHLGSKHRICIQAVDADVDARAAALAGKYRPHSRVSDERAAAL